LLKAFAKEERAKPESKQSEGIMDWLSKL